METFELRYFLAVANEENVHRASERLKVSPASLSKAVARLEAELGVGLFSREGKRIRLTDHGRLLQRRASEILHLEESSRLEISGHRGTVHAVIAGPEILLARFGVEFSRTLLEKFPGSVCEFRHADDEAALAQVARGEAHLAFVTSEVDLRFAQVLAKTNFQTCVGRGHPLYAKADKPVSVEQVLEYGFVSPSLPLLGRVGRAQSADGWRDDKFPRRVSHLASSLKVLEEILLSGRAIAYLPDYYREALGAKVLRVTGCPYVCVQNVRRVCRNPRELGWLRQLT